MKYLFIGLLSSVVVLTMLGTLVVNMDADESDNLKWKMIRNPLIALAVIFLWPLVVVLLPFGIIFEYCKQRFNK